MLLAVLVLAACGGGGDGIEVGDVRIGQPTGPNAALYFTVENHTDGADVLESIETTVASSAEIHETIMDDDGTMRMQPLDRPLEIGPGASLVLEPGGIHVMLMDVEPLEVGQSVEVTLVWQVAGEVTVDAEVVEPGDTMDHEGHDG